MTLPDTAIILAGGSGTRLGALTAQTPKPLLPVGGKPFVAQVIEYLAHQGVRRVVLATGHLGDQFERALGRSWAGAALAYSRETEPLGTGGALVRALAQVPGPTAFVLNGDTYFPAELAPLAAVQAAKRAAFSIAFRRLPEVARYGCAKLEDGVVTALNEKGGRGPGLINGGVYLVNRAELLADAPAGKFSLEQELLPRWVARRAVAGVLSDAYFIDIGIPEDLARARRDLGGGS